MSCGLDESMNELEAERAFLSLRHWALKMSGKCARCSSGKRPDGLSRTIRRERGVQKGSCTTRPFQAKVEGRIGRLTKCRGITRYEALPGRPRGAATVLECSRSPGERPPRRGQMSGARVSEGAPREAGVT